MQFDFKITSWVRASIPEEDEKRILKLIESGKICNVFDLMDELSNTSYHIKPLQDTWEEMTVEENGGASTIEVYDGDGDIIHSNANDV